jgi:hypothetical protein
MKTQKSKKVTELSQNAEQNDSVSSMKGTNISNINGRFINSSNARKQNKQNSPIVQNVSSV